MLRSSIIDSPETNEKYRNYSKRIKVLYKYIKNQMEVKKLKNAVTGKSHWMNSNSKVVMTCQSRLCDTQINGTHVNGTK